MIASRLARRGSQRPAESPRPHSALRIRARATGSELDPEDLHQRLHRKLEVIDRTMRRVLGPLEATLAPPTVPSETTPATPALYAVPGDRLATPEGRRRDLGYAIAAHYWASQPYQGRPLPRMIWSVEVWKLTAPGRIHLLDLPVPLLVEAYSQSPLIAELGRGGRLARTFADLSLAQLEQETADAIRFVRLDPVAASRSPYAWGLRAELVRRSQDGVPRHNEQARARAAMTDLDQASDVDLSRERVTACQLERLLARYHALRRQGKSVREAFTCLASEWDCTPKRIEARLSDARLHDQIQESWANYQDWSARPAAGASVREAPTA